MWLSQKGEVMEHEKSSNAAETRLLGRDETARYLGTMPRSVDRLVGQGVLKPVPIPGLHRTLFDKTDFDQLIDAGKGHGQETAA